MSAGSGLNTDQLWCFHTPVTTHSPHVRGQALSWCKSVQPIQSVMPQGTCPSWGDNSLLLLTSHGLKTGWEKQPTDVLFITADMI